MSAVLSPQSYYEDFLQSQARSPQGPDRVAQLRAEAMARFVEQGFPGARQEDWKYTNVSVLAKRRYALAAFDPQVLETALVPFLLPELPAYRLVFVNGRYAPALSCLHHLPSGVHLSGLADAMESHPEVLEQHLGRYVDLAANPLAAWNTAFFADGAFLHLGRGAVLDKPVHLLFVSTGGAQTVSHPRNLVVAEDNSQAMIIETHAALEQAEYLANAVTEIVAGSNAVIEHCKLTEENEHSYRFANLHVQQGRDSRYLSHNLVFGGRLVRNDLRTVLAAEGAECTLNGLYLGAGRQHIDNQTRIDHLKPHGTSRETYKGVLDGQARGVFRGRITVHEQAQKTDAQQTNNNLLLSENAEADSMPQLEIYADDVKCAHGSTVGHLDQDALFYLRTRALAPEVARSLLVYAFAAEVLERIALEPLRRHLEHLLTGKLLRPGAGALGLHAVDIEELL